MDRLSAYGIALDVPTGWEAELSLQDADETDAGPPPAGQGLVVLHAANFWLPTERDDYGAEALEAMGPAGVFIALVEFDHDAVGSLLFEHQGIPADLQPDDFDPAALRRPMREQAGLQRFFHAAGRAFCLHAAIGSHNNRYMLTQDVNSILSGLTIEKIRTSSPAPTIIGTTPGSHDNDGD